MKLQNPLIKTVLAGILALPATSANAADIQEYRVFKGHLYEQTADATPVPTTDAPYDFTAQLLGDSSLIFSAEVRSPLGATLSLEEDFSGLGYSLGVPFMNLSQLNTVFPNGNYTYTIDTENDSLTVASLNLGADAFPTSVPRLLNYTAAQSINPAASFTLNWNAFAEAGANDNFELEVIDETEVAVFTDSGTGTSSTIPAGTLTAQSTFTLRIRFLNETGRDESSYPGAVGRVGFYNETELTISTGGSGGGGDQVPPVLFFSTPASGAVNVPVNSVVTFFFNEEMANNHAIEWSANLNSASFTYQWSANKKELTCTYQGGLPANALITWKLNPTVTDPNNFRDLAGNMLPPMVFQGTFTTGTGTVDPCQGGNPDPTKGYFLVNKNVNYVQTGNADPVFDTEMRAMFAASFKPPQGMTVNSILLGGPGGINLPLQNQFGQIFTAFQVLDSAALLDTTFPSGSYSFNVNSSAGAQIASLPLSASSQVPVPKILNLPQLSTLNIANDFTLQFSAYQGAGQDDGIFIEISDDAGSVFMAPDPCKQIELANTATSVVIPANTFKSGKTYEGTIRFDHRTGVDNSTFANTSGTASVSSSTRFTFTVGGGSTPTAPRWLQPVNNGDGSITFTLQGESGRTYIIEGTVNYTLWDLIKTEAAALNGTVQVQITPGTIKSRFLRARVQ